MDQSLENLLNRDPIAEAEWLYNGGERWDSREGPNLDQDKAMDFLRHAAMLNAAKDFALTSAGDSSHSTTLAEYKGIIANLGFRKVFETHFTSWSGDNDSFYIYFRDNGGVLLCFDTYGGNRVNSGKFYYNWVNKNYAASWASGVTSSGGVRGDVWSGDHDCREAIRHKIGKLEENGYFVTPWKARPFLWLLHYMDPKGLDGKEKPYDYDQINRDRIAMLPEEVRAALGEERAA